MTSAHQTFTGHVYTYQCKQVGDYGEQLSAIFLLDTPMGKKSITSLVTGWLTTKKLALGNGSFP